MPPGTFSRLPNPPQRRANNGTGGQTDRQTDGRTSDRCIDPAAHTLQTVSKSILRNTSDTCDISRARRIAETTHVAAAQHGFARVGRSYIGPF